MSSRSYCPAVRPGHTRLRTLTNLLIAKGQLQLTKARLDFSNPRLRAAWIWTSLEEPRGVHIDLDLRGARRSDVRARCS